jgi:hypothetical protein
MADVELNWATAEVKDGKLAVGLEGEVPKGWKRHFEMTDTLLAGGDWGKVRIKKETVYVSDVSRGTEERLRHHLESVVEQANSAVRGPESEPQEGPAEEDGDTPDARMTESFRAFAKASEERDAGAVGT